MSVIELGFVTEDDPVERVPRPLRLRDVRRGLVAVVAALSLLGLTGSARPESHGLRQLWSVPFQEGNSTFSLGPELIYVLDTQQSKLTAYGIRDGVVRWSSAELGRSSWVGAVDAGVLLLPSADAQVQLDEETSREFTRETVAVDAATGEIRWRQAGEFFLSGDGRVLLVNWDDVGGSVKSLNVVSLRDGTPLWSRPGKGLESWVGGGNGRGVGTDRLVTIGEPGDVQVYDMADGRVLSRGTVPWMGQGRRDDAYSNVTVEGHTFYLETVVRDEGTLTAYDTETMHLKWRIEGRSYGGFFPCGPVLCMNGSNGVTGYDRETGTVRWETTGQVNGLPTDGDTIVIADDGADNSRQSLADSTTGQRFADLGTGVQVWDLSMPEYPRYLLNHTLQPTGLMSVGEVGATGKVALRGAMPPIQDFSCQSTDDLLICLSTDARLTVTDVG